MLLSASGNAFVCTEKDKNHTFNTSDAETGTFCEKYVYAIAADSMAPFAARSSLKLSLIM